MATAVIEEYFTSHQHKPFFLVVGDDEYMSVKSKLSEIGIEIVNLSDCCRLPDKRPDLDILREKMRTLDVNSTCNKIAIIGLGEYLALEGEEIANNVLEEFKEFNLGSGYALLLLRCVNSVISSISKYDPRFDNRRYKICGIQSTLSIMLSTMELKLYEIDGIKKLISKCEDGFIGELTCNTDLTFENSLVRVKRTKSSYEALCRLVPDFTVDLSYGKDEYWNQLLLEINTCGSMTKVYENHRYPEKGLDEIYSTLYGERYSHWLFFVYIMQMKSNSNPYIEYVISISNSFETFKYNLLNGIIDINPDDSCFEEMYNARKKIVRSYPEAEIAQFVNNNRINEKEEIYRLTDNTNVEKEEIISYIAKYGVPKNLLMIYPDLATYLKTYHFKNDSMNERLTTYFESYKKSKLANKISEELSSEVDKLACSREYNRLRTRDEIITAIDHKGTFLCWIDALGVEYLSFILEGAKMRGLSIAIKVGRADLPTITSINKGFYENWPTDQKLKIEELDDIKHKEKGGYKFSANNPYPIHLAKELDVINEVLDHAAIDLGLHKWEKYVIASDHGASRLAVIQNKEEKYETDTRGEHSGRCCKTFQGYDLQFATEENGFIILADYGRFKGSRAANVEVHGGASLEEVVVPIIELSLKDNDLTIKVVENAVAADYKTGSEITLFVNKNVQQDIFVEVEKEMYKAVQIDSNHYKVALSSLKRAKTYSANILLGEEVVSMISIKVTGKSASMNDDFDDLF